MESIKLKAHINHDGVLTVQMPSGVADVDAEIVVYYGVQSQPDESKAVDKNGWPIGFFDRTYGSLADDPIERPPEAPLDVRDEIE